MTPKEKAKELLNKFNFEHKDKKYILYQTPEESIRCALIAVDLAIEAAILYVSQEVAFEKSKEYWQQVKQEILNL